ncbi:5-oxoprolinase subunit PxpA [Paucilactobacillus suebicus]|uniref:5-oxoprolinase subunit A n=1 Tax=Paucilactobacillus suebicus DSM 5007 = KCTC 3549 TaxID=1423807 RepID=A0A0R1W5L2_9LACO|nr:5-oxoprolinase subunit PxpA [Paucilactobacillus suebicus]KRM12757.1 LamB YcsF family protein [Paucilactobacillus suebicus DSM 5007 = KCTC 3549]
MVQIDLNCDLGESFGRYKLGLDEQVLPYITSANIACGFHAGDPEVMEHTVDLASENHVALGAHPGFHDLEGFGRRQMQINPQTAEADVRYQVGALQAFSPNHKLHHVKPHGALYNMAAKDYDLASAICKGIYAVDHDLILIGLANSELIHAAKEIGLPYAQEVFADRNYEVDGSLMSRSKPNSVITDEDVAVARVIQMVEDHSLKAYDGTVIEMIPDTVCVHGDGIKAVAFVKKIHQALNNEGIEVKTV